MKALQFKVHKPCDYGPVIYAWFRGGGICLYIGRTDQLEHRLTAHNVIKGNIHPLDKLCVWLTVESNNKFMEQVLIHYYKPVFNKDLSDKHIHGRARFIPAPPDYVYLVHCPIK